MNRKTSLISGASLVIIAALAGLAVASPAKLAPGGRLPSNASGGNTSDLRISASAGTVAYYSNGKFKSTYRERVNTTTVTQTFKFEMEAFTPNTDVPVLLNGVQVATAMTNAQGGGEFQFVNNDNNPGPNDAPLPSGFPRLRAGDIITIGNLTATYH